jgi:hypothetical protein
MKRNFKLKALVLSMIVMMGLTLVPSLNAATVDEMKFTNHDGVTADNAEAVFSYTVDKTNYAPGDIITVSVNVDKSTENGITAISSRIGFDNTKLEVVKCNEEGEIGEGDDYTYDYVKAGDIGKKLKIDLDAISIRGKDITGNADISVITVAAARDYRSAAKGTGTIFEVKLKVKDDASGALNIFLLSDNTTYAGFDTSAALSEANSEGRYQYRPTYYVDTTSMDGLVIPVAATAVEFKNITSVELDKTSKKSMDLTPYLVVTPSNTTDEIKWSVPENNGVAKVDTNGNVTAIGNGSTTVTVTVGEKTAQIPVNVTTSPSSVTFNQSKYVVNYEEIKDLKDEVKVGPEDAVYDASTITWTSSDESVATVDNGVVAAKGKGTATIKATVAGKTASTQVTVAVPLKSISLSTTAVTVYKGDDTVVEVTASPEGAEWETLEASPNSGAEYVLFTEVENGVKVTGKAEGTAVIAISANKNLTGNDLYKTVTVTVKENKITGAVIENEEGAELLRGETLEMVGSYTTQEDEEKVHKTTDDNTMTWESLNPEVATVDSKTGVVTAVKEGTATIKLTVAGQTAEYTVKVNEVHVDGVVISEEDQKALEEIGTLTVGDVVKVPFTVTPEGTITDTVEEILDFVNVDYDKDLVDITV